MQSENITTNGTHTHTHTRTHTHTHTHTHTRHSVTLILAEIVVDHFEGTGQGWKGVCRIQDKMGTAF